ncbi:hypothetical protein H4R33_007137, partial [Dimargaris cristalligena]
EYNSTIQHHPGYMHNNTDGLSWLATPPVVDLQDELLVSHIFPGTSTPTFAIQLFHPKVTLPMQATPGSVGYDLMCITEFDLIPHQCTKVATG